MRPALAAPILPLERRTVLAENLFRLRNVRLTAVDVCDMCGRCVKRMKSYNRIIAPRKSFDILALYKSDYYYYYYYYYYY